MKRIQKWLLLLVSLIMVLASLPCFSQPVSAAGGPLLSVALAANTPPKRIVAVGDSGVEETAISVDMTPLNEDIAISSITIKAINVAHRDVVNISLWDGSTQIGSPIISLPVMTFIFPNEKRYLLKTNVIKNLSIKVKFTGIKTDFVSGTTSGDIFQIGIDQITGYGVVTCQYVSVEPNILGNEMVLYKSKPTIAAASLPSTVLSAGEKTLYRAKITADRGGNVSWQTLIFEVAGSIKVGADNFVIGTKISGSLALADGIYMETSNSTAKFIASESLKLFNIETGKPVECKVHVWNSPQKSIVELVACTAEIVPANQTKQYELKGNLIYDGRSGDAIVTRIPNINNFLPDNTPSFIWSDGVSWANDYLVPGIPTSSLSLTKDATAPATQIKIEAPTMVRPNEEFLVTIGVNNIEHFNACQYVVTFEPSVLQLNSIQDGKIGAINIPIAGQKMQAPGKYIIISCLPSATPEASGQGYLAKLSFRAIGTGKSAIVILADGLLSQWPTGKPISALWIPTAVEVKKLLAGDLNGDDAVNVFDCTQLIKMILGIEPITPNADINGDGQVNILDLTKLWSIILGQ